MNFSLDQIPWIKQQGEKEGRIHISLMGITGWFWDCGEAFLIGIQIEFQQKWLTQLSLLLVACETAIDDALVLEQGKYFLYRRYDATLSQVEIEAQLNTQLALIQILERVMSGTHQTIPPINELGKFA